MSKQSYPETSAAPIPRTSRIWNGSAFETDAWNVLADDQQAVDRDYVAMSLDRWRAEKSKLQQAGAMNIAIRLAAGDVIDPESDEIDRLALIVLPFPKFTDGRSYSTARRLREQWGYANELRAAGDVLIDQIPLMARCGFTSFEITEPSTIRALERPDKARMCRMYQSPTLHGALRRRAALPRDLAAAE